MASTIHKSGGVFASEVRSGRRVSDSAESQLVQKARPDRLILAFVAIAAVEFICVAAAAFGVTWLYDDEILPPDLRLKVYLLAACFIGAAEVSISAMTGQFAHLQKQRLLRFAWGALGSVLATFLTLTSIFFVLKLSGDYSRGILLLQLISCSVAAVAVRFVIYSLFQKAAEEGLIQRQRVVLLGGGGACAAYALQLGGLGGGIKVSACLLPLNFLAANRADFDQSLGADVVEQCRLMQPDSIIVLIDKEQEDRKIGKLLALLRQIPADIYALPTHGAVFWANARPAQIGGLATFELSRRPLSLFDLAIKRTLDIVAATVGIIILWPLLVLASLAVVLDSKGPMFFVQTRHGYNNEAIRVLKFRTMYVRQEAEFRQTTQNDARVTRIGRIFRITGVDELPQLWNILRGDMSLVGPRPHAIEHNELFNTNIASFDRRHTVKPGLTGWAQVNGHRGETDTVEKMQKRIEHDLFYIDNWSLLFDLKIIFLTLFSRRTYLNAR